MNRAADFEKISGQIEYVNLTDVSRVLAGGLRVGGWEGGGVGGLGRVGGGGVCAHIPTYIPAFPKSLILHSPYISQSSIAL